MSESSDRSDRSDREARLEELLVEQTERALSYQEAAEVRQLLRELPDWREDDIELAAAAAMVAFTTGAAGTDGRASTLPGTLRKKIAEQARVILDEDLRDSPPRSDTVREPKVVELSSRRRTIVIAVSAAAAAVLLAILAWWWLAVFRAETPGASESRQALLAEAKDVITTPWSPAGDPLGAPVSGDVVWSPERQAGFMRFVGLKPNDATQIQYQLWIFDGDRDERYPVDGGVFDIDAATGDVIVRIDPKVRVTKATMFAVTVERPGGVVVSSRERLVVLAKVI